ncbi:MAG TPA: DinB family protein [Thermoanaerobaculia bacterium]
MATLAEIILPVWHTANRVTTFLVENLPRDLMTAALPASPRRTIGTLVTHLHNVRCMWVRTLGEEHGLVPPEKIDRAHVLQRRQLVAALQRSGRAVGKLLQLGCDHGGTIPPSRRYVWRNLQLDVGHVLAYLVAHEAHHRGQIVMAARELGRSLSAETTEGLWQWRQRERELR